MSRADPVLPVWSGYRRRDLGYDLVAFQSCSAEMIGIDVDTGATALQRRKVAGADQRIGGLGTTRCRMPSTSRTATTTICCAEEVTAAELRRRAQPSRRSPLLSIQALKLYPWLHLPFRMICGADKVTHDKRQASDPADETAMIRSALHTVSIALRPVVHAVLQTQQILPC